MNERQALLEALCAAVRGRRVSWPEEALTDAGWEALLLLSRQQQVTGLVMQAVYAAPAFLALEDGTRRTLLQSHRAQVVSHTRRTAALAALWQQLENSGLHPVIMKGAACRSVYPAEGVRPSSDEDVLVPDGEFHRCIAFLKEQGFTCGEVAEETLGKLSALLAPCGVCARTDEAHADAGMTAGGCTPAYTYLFIDALAAGGERAGLSREDALSWAAAAVAGAAELLMQSGKMPGQLCSEVCSPGGSTIEGVNALRDGGFEQLVAGAFEKSWKKNGLLGK